MAKKKVNVDDIISSLRTLGSELTDEDRDEISLWHKGKALAHVVNTDGWDVVLEILQGYVTNAVDQVAKVKPGDTDRILAAHSILYATSEIHRIFVEDVQAAIDAARKPPDILIKNANDLKTSVPPTI